MPDTDPDDNLLAVVRADHRAEVTQNGALGQNLALTLSAQWAAWARQVDGLLRTRPDGPQPSYRNEDGDTAYPSLELPCGTTREHVGDQLRRARADADAIAAAYEHLAEEISRRTEAILNPPKADHEHQFSWPLVPGATPLPCKCGEPSPLPAERPGGAR